MNYLELKNYINSDSINNIFLDALNCDDVLKEKNRYIKLLEEVFNKYGDGDYHIISSPGRSEIGGNHTDHQHGHVIACSLNIDNVVIFKKNDSNIVNYFDKDFRELKVNIDDLSINEKEYNHSEALIKGIVAKIKELGYKVSGFDAICDSHVLAGSGISSSACFEVMIAEIINYLYCDEKISDVDRAIISQYAENVYFGKPSGLMDQMAISVGSFISIDFKNIKKPEIEKYDFSFEKYGYDFVLVNTKGDHVDLSDEYAAIPNEIKEVAKLLDVEYLADTNKEKLYNNLNRIRNMVKNDRALLRSFHIFNEDKRAIEEKEAIIKNDINKLLKLMKESGRSSYEYLQNVYPATRTNSQSLALGLFIADDVLEDDGAYRVHGGGFDGTIQCIVPKNKMNIFAKYMSLAFGNDSIMIAKVRPTGTKVII